jgi:hypothetical protein
MNTLTRWFIINAGIVTASFFAYTKGLFGTIISNDVSYIAAATMVLFVGLCAYLGKIASLADKPLKNKQELIDKLDFGWFASGHFLNLGLLGTVVGFCFMIGSTLQPNAEINATIQTLKLGAGTALYTTAVGLVTYMLSQVQLYVIQSKLKKS